MTTLARMPFEQYAAIEACSQSALVTIRDRSPAHWRCRVDEPSDAMVRGTAMHAAILEPQEFEARYFVAPDVDRRTKAGKEQWAAFVEAADGREVMSAEAWHHAMGVRTAVWSHRAAAALLSERTACEVVLQWERDGIPCKGRIDALTPHAIIDIKTTRSAKRGAFARAIGRYGYHMQAAWYLDGAAACGEKRDLYAIVAVEPEPPYAVAVYTLDDESIEIGRIDNDAAFKRYSECWRSGQWPAYGDGIEDIAVPDWYRTEETTS